jgi:predicted transcriptional regulator
MTTNNALKFPINQDTAKQIHELHREGLGRNQIAQYLETSAAAVRAVLEGSRMTFSSDLNIRQRQSLLNQGFRVD